MCCMYDSSHWVVKGPRPTTDPLAVDEGEPWFGLSCVIAEVNSVRIVLLEPQKGS